MTVLLRNSSGGNSQWWNEKKNDKWHAIKFCIKLAIYKIFMWFYEVEKQQQKMRTIERYVIMEIIPISNEKKI